MRIKTGSLVASNRRADSTTHYHTVREDYFGILPTELSDAGWQLAESRKGHTIAVRVSATRRNVRNWSVPCYDVERRSLDTVAGPWVDSNGDIRYRIMAALGENLPTGLARVDATEGV